MDTSLELFFQSELLWQSLLGTILIGLNFSILGTTLVEKKLSLIGDTFSHAILPGVVLGAALWGTHPGSLLLGGWIAGLLLLVLTYLISKKRRGYRESSFAFLAVFFVAIGMILSFKTQKSSEILHLLLGNILAFDTQLLLLTAAVSLLTWTTYFAGRHIWSIWILDPDFIFHRNGLMTALRFLAPFLLVTNLILGLYALGAMMTVGLLVIPCLTAQLFCVRLYNRVFAAAGLSCVYSVIGFLISYQWDWPLGPSLIFVAGLFHVVALGFIAISSRKVKFT